MTVKEFKRAVRKAKAVFGYVLIWREDGEYLQVQKQSVLASLEGVPADAPVEADWRGEDLYIS